MAKRRTIGDNPLDMIGSEPSTVLPGPKKRPTMTLVPTKGQDQLLQRIETLEQENQCVRWLVGAVLAPLALIAILL